MCTSKIINRGDYYLPKELITEILSRLPVKSLLRFKSVSKSWRDLIQTREFTNLHLKQSKESNSGGMINLFTNTNICTLNYHHPNTPSAVKLNSPTFLDYFSSRWNELGPPVLVGSCNGLICFALPFDRYFMYNPSTRVFKELPKVTRKNAYGFRVFSFLAYDHVNDDYKVFELFHYNEDYRQDNIVGAESLIFSMKANKWKTIDKNVPYYKSNFLVKNNSLRWVDRKAMLIRSFDFFSERYDEHISRVPNLISLLKGTRFGNLVEDFDVLMAEADNLEVEFVLWISYGYTTLPIVRSKDGGGPVVLIGLDGPNRRVIGWSGIKDGIVAEDRFPGLACKWESLISAKPWVESLVSLE
ncbi:F-box only protein 8-like [Silene latifolia]|uniref:F-box only protein 8-like n=1 Tax=Silene latifolia TaxID=37657 RepID=UPI003D76F2F9